MNPFFSIIIPTYNRAHFIKNVLDSVLNQTFDDFEVIIVDDGSTDNTKEVVNSYNSNKIIYCSKENAERGAARNYGIKKAKGKYITFIDSDDQIYPNHLEFAKNVIDTKNYDIFHQAYDFIDSSGKVVLKWKAIKGETANKAMLKGNRFGCIGVFVRRNIFDDILFSEDRTFSGSEDWLLWLQLSARYPLYAFSTVTCAMTQHDDRSVLFFDINNQQYRKNYLIQSLKNDSAFVKTYGQKAIDEIEGHMLSYIALHATMVKKYGVAFKYLVDAIIKSPSEIFSKRFLVIIKLLIFRK